MFEWFGQIFDVTLLATIGLVFAATLVAAYLRSKRLDPCLKSFSGYQVTLERCNGKIIWGEMALESSGLELLYRDSVQDANHIESSYIMYGDEYDEIQAIYRYADELDEENKKRRSEDVQKSFHPGPLKRMGRGFRHFISTASESLTEVVGLLVGRLKKPAGRYITDTGEAQIKNLSSSFFGNVGAAHDPLLENYIGHRMVIEMLEGDEVHEHVGIFKNYSAQFIEILNVQFPQRQALALGPQGCLFSKGVTAETLDGVMKVTNHTEQPVLLQSVTMAGDEELLNVVVNGGEQVELHLEKEYKTAELHMRVARELDMIIPRSRCIVRHRADRYEAQFLPEIIFDLGVMLTGSSKLEAREARLRKQLADNNKSALNASNLGAVLMQQEKFEDAVSWLEQAYEMRYSLPDNGQRTRMLLNEIRRRVAKSPEKAGLLATLSAPDMTAKGNGAGFTVQATEAEAKAAQPSPTS
ncbi:MAG: tetratricopeptide repeat protein [Caldilineaceae bacterium]|nr:tetratricopeptide repeat protein [Caldilineaceae bacterium]